MTRDESLARLDAATREVGVDVATREVVDPCRPVRRLRATPANTITPEAVTWLVRHMIPAGKLTCLAGRGGEGKSTLAYTWAAQATTGTLDGDYQGQPRNVGIVSYEDDWPSDITPRLLAAGADLSRVYQLDAETVLGDDVIDTGMTLDFPRDATALGTAIRDHELCLVVIDPASSAITGDPNSVKDVRAFTDPLRTAVRDTGCGLVIVHHFNKGAGRAGDRVSGSHAWRDAVRSLITFAEDPDTGKRVLTVDKINGAGRGASYEFNLDVVDAPNGHGGVLTNHHGQPVTTVRVGQLTPSTTTVQAIIDAAHSPNDPERSAVTEWLIDYLTTNGASNASDVIGAGKTAGFKENTIKSARNRCRNPSITTTRSAYQGTPVWRLATPLVALDTIGSHTLHEPESATNGNLRTAAQPMDPDGPPDLLGGAS